jgi:hypothetical protein
VRGRVGDHRVAQLARPALAPGPAHRRRTRRPELCEQRVPRALELLDARDPRLRGADSPGSRHELPLVARELSLEAPDLATKLPPRRDVIGLEPGVGEVEFRGELLEVELRLVELGVLRRLGGKALVEGLGEGGGDQRDDGDVSRIHVRFAGALDRLRGEALDVVRAGGVVGDEGAEPVPCGDDALLLQPGVHAAYGVDVHAGPLGQRADARHPLSRSEPAGRNQGPEPPGELHAHRKLVGRVGAKRRPLGIGAPRFRA